MTNRIPVTRLLAEAVTVILSILVAFGIDAWWDGRKADALQREVMISLERGFEENVRLARAVADEARRQQVLMGRFVAMTPDEAGRIPADSTYWYLRALWRPNYVYPVIGGPVRGGRLNNAALIATLQAGQLSLLTDTHLLDAVAAWQGVAEDLAQRTDEVVISEREVLDALTRYPELQAALAGFDADGELPAWKGEAPRLDPAITRRVRADVDLMGRVTRKGFVSRAQQDFLMDLSVRADSVLTLIRAELGG